MTFNDSSILTWCKYCIQGGLSEKFLFFHFYFFLPILSKICFWRGGGIQKMVRMKRQKPFLHDLMRKVGFLLAFFFCRAWIFNMNRMWQILINTCIFKNIWQLINNMFTWCFGPANNGPVLCFLPSLGNYRIKSILIDGSSIFYTAVSI